MDAGFIKPNVSKTPRPSERPRQVEDRPVSLASASNDQWQPVGLDAQERARRLGLSTTSTTHGLPSSEILRILGSDRFVQLEGVRVEGTSTWVNTDVARALGLEVPADNKLTPELQNAILETAGYRLLGPNESSEGRPTVTLHADRYGGSGLGGAGGSGRAAFLPHGNLSIKGVGVTPLRADDPEKFHYSHGGASLREGIREAIFGELNYHLFHRDSTRVLALIDTGEFTHYPDGSQEHRVLIVRAGQQVRPGHMMEGFSSAAPQSEGIFLRATEQSGDLIRRRDPKSGELLPDISATLRHLLKEHAHVNAEQFRWRILHGAITTSNIELGAGMIDLATESSLPTTRSLRSADHLAAFGQEHLARALELQSMYDALLETMPNKERRRLNAGSLELMREVEREYDHALQFEMLQATGMKPAIAAKVLSEHSKRAQNFLSAVQKLLELGSNKTANVQEAPLPASAVDVFKLLRHFPRSYFSTGVHNLTQDALDFMRPEVAKPPALDPQRAKSAARGFVKAFEELMDAAERHWPDGHESLEQFRASVIARSEFENRPMEKLFYADLNDRIIGAVDGYRDSGDSNVIRRIIDETVAASLRSIDGLLRQGDGHVLPDGTLEHQRRTIEGVQYTVQAQPDGARSLRISVPLANRETGFEVMAGDGGTLSRDELSTLLFHHSLDGWKTEAEIAPVIHNQAGIPSLEYTVPLSGQIAGSIEGLFRFSGRDDAWVKDRGDNFRGYSFAVPDKVETRELIGELGGVSNPGEMAFVTS